MQNQRSIILNESIAEICSESIQKLNNLNNSCYNVTDSPALISDKRDRCTKRKKIQDAVVMTLLTWWSWENIFIILLIVGKFLAIILINLISSSMKTGGRYYKFLIWMISSRSFTYEVRTRSGKRSARISNQGRFNRNWRSTGSYVLS